MKRRATTRRGTSTTRSRRRVMPQREFQRAIDAINRRIPRIGSRQSTRRGMNFLSQFGPLPDFEKNFEFDRDNPENLDLALSVQSNNMYIHPGEVLTLLEHNPGYYHAGYLNLDAIYNDLFDAGRIPSSFVEFIEGDRREAGFDNDGYVRNEIAKMNRGGMGGFSTLDDMFPFILNTGENSDDQSEISLVIPVKDVFDLPVYLMLYILQRLSSVDRRRIPGYTVGFTLGVNSDNADETIHLIHDSHDRPIRVMNNELNPEDLKTIYMTIMRYFISFAPDTYGNLSWNGSEGSGTRIMLRDSGGGTADLYLNLVLTPIATVNRGHKWTQEVEDLLMKTVGSSVMSVRNRDDNKCLLYCIVMGLIIKFKEGGNRVFGVGTMMVEPCEVYCKGMYLYAGKTDELSELIKKLSSYLIPTITPPQPSPDNPTQPIDPMIEFIHDLDRKASTAMSVIAFREEFETIESTLIYNGYCGIDVYGIDYNITPHIYPLYISKNRTRILELLCVTPLDERCSHYCLITNMEKLLKGSGGKQFFSCAKCGASFYHKRLLRQHSCGEIKIGNISIENNDGYHYSNKYAVPGTDLIVGACPKCRLYFTDDFTFEYHKQHCLTQKITGYRHVQLITYKPTEPSVLRGEEIDMEQEDEHVKQSRIMYADFESSINPETGEHTFMSYGIYDWEDDEFMIGYTLDYFFEFILHKAFFCDANKIYVYFHNAMGYDANFILRYVLSQPEHETTGIEVIMKSSSKLQKLVFKVTRDGKTKTIHIGDTFLFLTLSLEKIVDSIRKDDVKENIQNFERFFKVMERRNPYATYLEIDHILRKNIFPYKFFTDSSKLDTPKDEFLKIFEPLEENLKYFSERVTLEDLKNGYEDTEWVMHTFICNTARDYHDLYLCCDVMQLADVFNRSMNILWVSHHIHLTRYLGMPGASWAAFLRFDPTMEIPLYEDTFFAEFFQGMIRGGITSAALRHAKADSKHSIIYLDVNGLYPYVMQKYKFPCGQFDFVPMGWEGELCAIKLKEYFEMFERESKGMCFCVDVTIPEEVKLKTDMYPFLPEHRKIFHEYYKDFEKRELTPFLQRWSDANKGAKMSEFCGLVCTLYDKKKYNVHWRLLKFYLEHGVKVTKVYFGILFNEGDYLAGYIRKNIEIRNTRSDVLGKTLYKLLGNSIYGKTFESPFKRSTFEIIRDKTKLQGLISEGNIASMTPIDDLGWIVKMDGSDIKLDRPTFIGACVCEFSKLHMYTLLYDKVMPMFPDGPLTEYEELGDYEDVVLSHGYKRDIGCQLVYTDTDSFILQLRHPDGVEITSPEQLFAYIKSKDPDLIGGIGGQVKSETGEDETIQEIIALRSKVYAYITTKGHVGKRAKGTTYDAQEMQLDWETYKKALETLTSVETRNNQFVRKYFKISSIDMFRQSLSVNDGKRYICDDGIHTHAFGFDL